MNKKNNIEGVIDLLNEAMKELFDWCKKNQLTVHTGKTEAIIISHRNFTGPLRPVWSGSNFNHKLCYTQHLPRNNN